MRRISSIRAIWFSSALALGMFTGCSLGEVTAPAPDPAPGDDAPPTQQDTLVDSDGDGVPDGFDLDGDGIADIGLEDLCAEPLLDANGDGIPEGLDFDCDGVSDECIPGLVDDDGDGVPDGIDLDCDGASDFGF